MERLSDLLDRRGRLAPPEVVTLVVGLALDLIDRDHVHGGIGPDVVEFAPDGRPMLADGASSDVCVSPEVARGWPPGPADDVFAVAAIGYRALSGESVWAAGDADGARVRAAAGRRTPLADLVPSAPAALVEAIEAGLADDPDQRCDARELAERVLASGPAAPLRLAVSPAAPAFDATTARRTPAVRSPKWMVALSVPLLAGVAVVVLSRPATRPVSWAATLARFDEARSAAVTSGRPGALLDVYATGSPQLARDVALIRDLARRHLTVRGRLARLTVPRVVSMSADAVVLAAIELPASYVVVDSHARVVLRVGGGPVRHVRVRLQRTRSGWRLVDCDERGENTPR